MSAMLLCRSRRVKNPYYVEELGVHLYSGEELSYYIYHNAMLIDRDFLDERLFRFIGQELGMENLENKLRRWSGQADLSELLLVILQDIHYYNAHEQAAFRKSLEEVDSMSPAQKLMTKGDYLVKKRRYTAAMLQYDRLINGEYEEMVSHEFRAKVWKACGVVYARTFCWMQAADCLKKSWECMPSESVQRMLVQIRCQDPSVEIPAEILEEVPEPTLQQWKEQWKEASEGALTLGKGKKAADWMDKDNIRRAAGLRELTEEWKLEYRRNQGG